jgi:hypothetical protein
MGRLAAKTGNLALALRIHGRKAALGRRLGFERVAHDQTLLLVEGSTKHSKTVENGREPFNRSTPMGFVGQRRSRSPSVNPVALLCNWGI